jgi:outer membrane receptor protein involved in Fe transport
MIQLLWAAFLACGLTGKIQGEVRDEATGQPIPYANVVILNTEIGAACDEGGNFFILNVPPGRYKVEVSCMGYGPQRIDGVTVEVDQTARLAVALSAAAIEMAPVVISGTTPAVKKDMVGSTYVIRQAEIATLPVDYIERLIAFQPSVANVDTALHVRGGRATEVLYMIDNVSIIDPQTGDPAISIAKGIIDEVIFLPGGFDAEYGRAMSGVVNLITEHPRDKLGGRLFGKTETIMPFYYDFGYQDYQATLHLPVSKRFKGLFAADLMHTDDWDPRLYILPHKQRDDYALYGKWLYAPSGKLNLGLSAAKSRTQFDRYAPGKGRYLQDHYRSDLRKGNLQTLNISFLPDSRKLFNLILSRLSTRRVFGVRNERPEGIFDDYTFRPYLTLKPIHYGNKNPWGVWSSQFYSEGDYGEYQEKTSLIIKTEASADLQLQKNHNIKAGAEYSCQDFSNFDYIISNDTLMDNYEYFPKEYSLYLQDNIDYQGLYAKVGGRYDYFSSGIKGIAPKSIISPRLGFSFLVTEKFLFRANIGRYCQPPLYDYLYGYYRLLPAPPATSKLIGNPNLRPEQTISYEIGLQGKINKALNITVNSFYKDISDLVGTRMVYALPNRYATYLNVEYGNVKGIEAIVDFKTAEFSGKVSYTLSWARGTSSYAQEVYDRYYYQNPDTTYTPPAQLYNLDFDQRHRFFIQGIVNLPWQSTLNIFTYFGNGFPYTPPGSEGKLNERNITLFPFQKQVDCVIVKPLRIGKISVIANLEIVNVLDVRNEITFHSMFIPLSSVHPENFHDYYTLTMAYYHPAADFNHDGLITPEEEYTAYVALVKATDDWVNAYTAPRRARIGVSVNF